MKNMQKTLTLVLVTFFLGSLQANAETRTATPDPALVERYTNDKSALKAKIAECKKKGDLVAIYSDVACVSADKAMKNHRVKQIASKCSLSKTFVFVPPGMKGKELESYLLKNAPAESDLKACNQTKEQWLRSTMNSQK